MNFALTPDMVPWIISGGAALMAVVIAFAFTGGSTLSTGAVERRVRRNEYDDSTRKSPTGRRAVRRNERLSDNDLLDSLLRRIFPNPYKVRMKLERTGKAISVGEYVLSMIITTLLVAVTAKLSSSWDIVVCGLLGLLVGIVLPAKVVSFMGNRRVGKFMTDFPSAIEMIVRGLRSGLPFIESVNAVGKEFPDPVGIEFRRVADTVKLGQSVESALWDVAERINVSEFKFMIVALTIQRETGGNLAETLANLAELLRKRAALKLKIRALSSEARASAYIIGSLPFVMEFILTIASFDYARVLWTDERGITMATCGGIWMFIGYYVMYQMVNFEV